MQKLEFKADKEIDLTKAIIDKLPFLSRFDVKKILDNKDVKINNARVKENKIILAGDNVTVFYQPKESKEWYTLVYYDDNVLIVNKFAGIEVVSETERDLLSILKQTYPQIKAVHRLDRNTEGLTIFALNEIAEKTLLSAFKNRKEIIKKYALLVEGRVDISKIKRTVYLKKVQNLAKVWISEVKTSGYEPIITQFDIVEYLGDKTLMEATLITGKTHQIRAHIAYYGFPIVGDSKYGTSKDKTLHLTANFLAFKFAKTSPLKYLNNQTFEIVPTWL